MMGGHYPVSALEQELGEYRRRIKVAEKEGDAVLAARLAERCKAVEGLLGVRESHAPAPVEKRPAQPAKQTRTRKKAQEDDD